METNMETVFKVEIAETTGNATSIALYKMAKVGV